MIELWTEEGQILLGQEKPLVRNYEVSRIGEIAKRSGNNTNSFSIAPTTENLNRLRVPSNLNFDDVIQNKISAHISRNGAIVDVGFLRIEKYTAEEITASFFSGNTEIFELAKSTKINELDFSEYTHNYTAANVQASFSNQQGYIYPFIDYGLWETNSGTSTGLFQWLPAVFVHTIFEKFSRKWGLKLKGALFKHPLFKKLIIPYSQKGFPQIPAVENNLYEVIADSNISQVAQFGLVFPIIINFENEIKDNFGQFFTTTFQANSKTFATFNFEFDGFWAGPGTKQGTVELYQSISGVPTVVASAQVSDTTKSVSFTRQVNKYESPNFESYFITFRTNFFGLSFTLNYKKITISYDPELSEGRSIQPNWFLPDWTFEKLLKEICNIFCAISQTDNFSQSSDFFLFETNYRNLNDALDWSEKIDYNNKQAYNFRDAIEGYAKRNFFRYKESKDDKNLPNFFGDGFFEIQGDSLDEEKTVFESEFSATRCVRTFDNNTYLPYIPLYEISSAEAKLTPEPRILILFGNVNVNLLSPTKTSFSITSSSPTVNFSSAPFSYFSKSILGNEIDTLNFSLAYNRTQDNATEDAIIETFYNLQKNTIQNGKIVRLNAKLNMSDEISIDFKLPLYLGYPFFSYFKIEKIIELDEEGYCELELLQL